MIEENNFLTERELEVIQDDIIDSSNFPWYWTPVSTSDAYPFYCHILKSRGQEGTNSEWYDFFFPIVKRFIDKYNLFKGEYEVIRGALNDSLSFDDKHGDPHVDFREEHLGFIVYLTDSSGDTNFYKKKWEKGQPPELFNRDGHPELEIEKSISPKQGKIVCYNGLHYHSIDWKKLNERRVICIFAIKGEQNGVVL